MTHHGQYNNRSHYHYHHLFSNISSYYWCIYIGDFGATEDDADDIFARIVEKFENDIGEGSSAIILLHDHMYRYHSGLLQKLYTITLCHH